MVAFQEVYPTQLCVFLIFWKLPTFPTHHSVFDLYNIAIVKKSRSLNILDPSGPLMACYRSALPLPYNINNIVHAV